MKKLLLLAIVPLLFSCATTDPKIIAASPAGVVGEDLVTAAQKATAAFAQYESKGVDYTWAVSFAFNAYRDIIKDSADVKALVRAWTAGKGQSLANRLAALFDASSGTPAQKTAALAKATQTVAVSTSTP